MKVKELLAKPEAWTQGVSARTAGGLETPVRDEEAVKWCLMGALDKCYLGDDTDDASIKYYNALSQMELAIRKFGFSSVAVYNDAKDRTHAEVLALATKLDI